MNLEMIRHRKELGISQHELAEVAKVPRYRVQLTEQGIPCLTLEETKRVLCKLGLVFNENTEWMVAMIEKGGEHE